MRAELVNIISFENAWGTPPPILAFLGSILRGIPLDFPDHQINIYIKIVYTLFVLILIPVYLHHWGPANFLWFSDNALFFSVAALWMESSLLASMMAVGVLVPAIYWNLEFFVRLLTGPRLAGLTDYFWNKKNPPVLRILTLFHIALPLILVLMLKRFGYDSRAIYFQSVLAVIILFLCYKLTPPSANINRTFGLGTAPQYKIPSKYFLILLMLSYILLIFIPTHYILRALFG